MGGLRRGGCDRVAGVNCRVVVETSQNLDVHANLPNWLARVNGLMARSADPIASGFALASSLERALTRDDVAHGGAVYTPSAIAQTIVRDTVTLWRRGTAETTAPPRILDPACGSGIFLVAAVEYLKDKYGVSIENAVSNFVRGVDVCPEATTSARTTLAAMLVWDGLEPTRAWEIADGAIVCRDFLRTPLTELTELLGVAPDLIVANPPYVKLQNLEPGVRTELGERFAGFAKGNFSLSILFLVRALDWNATCGFITQNNLFTSLAGRGCRELLQSQGRLLRIVDFGHHQVFPHASAYTCLLYAGPSRQSTHFEFASVHDEDVVQGLAGVSYSHIRFDELDAQKWRLAPRVDLDNIHRIESTGTCLGDVANIHVGFATLKDRAFVLSAREGVWGGLDPSGVWRPVDTEASRPFFKVSGMSGDLPAPQPGRILFPYGQDGTTYSLLAWEDIESRWPAAAAHLKRWKGALLARDRGRIPEAQWYRWGRRQSMDAPGPKLLTRTFSDRPRFVLDESDSLFCNGYSVSPRDGFRLTVVGLGRLLNSRVMHYYACVTSFHIQGGYQCYQKNFIERFGIPSLTPELVRALEGGDADLDRRLCHAYGIDTAAVDALLLRYRGAAG